ncbi:MAG: hypothetical protein LUG50_09580 [Planctomycetaceae bacterium]|nr:hypothetical protein [Planctomycetaceae bacterium]
MALLRLETNATVPEEGAKVLHSKLTRHLAPLFEEPENQVRLEIAANRRMRMATSDEQLVHLEIRNIEFPKDRAEELTDLVCPIIEDVLSIGPKSVYIAVISARNSMWRVNGDAGNKN